MLSEDGMSLVKNGSDTLGQNMCVTHTYAYMYLEVEKDMTLKESVKGFWPEILFNQNVRTHDLHVPQSLPHSATV